MKIRNFVLATALLSLPLVPLPASASAVCENGICTEIFQFTGSYQTWQVPSGVSTISFKVYGASGGRGGAGGEVRGDLSSLPNVLYVYVGGQGTEGANAPGGFNGGGPTTGNRGNEGSGGGASDIRFGTSLSDRVIVAGGGGGSGGYAGALGGRGGGLVAEAGGSGQGGGGGGGTQTFGGSAGYSNGGSPATSGYFGVGGTGGYSWNAGGGGGGGGWYGGGGGGPDDNSCCSDGGGGGGGSSYARSDITLNVLHQAGVNSGNGRVEISYQIPISLVSFTGGQVDSTLASFDLVMSATITGLTSNDFVVSPLQCQISAIEVAGMTAQISLTGCPHGQVELTLKSGAVGAAPSSAVSVTFNFDKQAPEFSWGEVTEASASADLKVSFNISGGEVEAFDIDAGGCSAAISDQELLLANCPEGENVITMPANQLVDEWGNSGPAQALSFYFLVDLSAPDAIWTEVEITQSENFRYQAILQLSEPSNFDPLSVVFTSDVQCSTGFEQSLTAWLFYAQCANAIGSWTLPALSMADPVGNLGPAQDRIVTFSNPASPAPQPEPSQPPTTEPSTPSQPQLNPPVSNDSTTESPSVLPTPVEQTEPTPPIAVEPVTEPILDTPSAVEPEVEPVTDTLPIFVVEDPIFLPPLPPVQEDTENQQFDSEISIEVPINEPEVNTDQGITQPIEAAQPVITEQREEGGQPPYLLFALAALVLIAGLAGLRIIGR